MKIKKIINKFREPLIGNILLLSALVFIVKFALAFAPSFSVDMGTWIAWAERMSSLGPAGFYSDEVWTQYTPGFLYYLWLLGEAGIASELAVKVPTILADMAVAYIIYRLVLPTGQRLASAAFVLYAVNPVVIFDGSVWGQIDGILTLFMLLGSALFIKKRAPLAAGVSLGISFLIKPQAAAIVPALLVIAASSGSVKIKYIVSSGFSAMAIILLSSLPFFPLNPIFGLYQLIDKMTSHYAFTSVFAFNFWALVGMWQSDTATFLGLTYFSWGIFLYLLALGASVYTYLSGSRTKGDKYLLIALVLFAAFLFPTRVHERYIFPVFAFLLPAAFLLRSKLLLLMYSVLSLLVLVNLYHPYAYYTDNWLSAPRLTDLSGALAKPIGAVLVASYFMLTFWRRFEPYAKTAVNKLKASRFKLHEDKKTNQADVSPKTARWVLAAILLFALVSRLVNLGFPDKHYFDEIYHAFTAQRMLVGDPGPWHWSSKHPEGFAYEWSHPPLAKEIMAGSIFIFGDHPISWRLPGVLAGVLIIYTTYLLALKLFNSREIALLSASLLALDGLLFTMSRIATADIYFVFFALAAMYLFLAGKDFYSSVFLGFALAAKWSTIWFLPVFALAFLLYREGSVRIAWYIFVPLAVYLASYLPMLTFGHDARTIWDMQKQMWWYHSGLDATHPYTSSWWSWPLMLRPVYLFQDYSNGLVANIYAMGNPVFFWSGLASIIATALVLLKVRLRPLIFLLASYFLLFAPWAASPRIMFLYHYLPALPFMAIITAYVFGKSRVAQGVLLVATTLSFLYFLPHFNAMHVPEWWDKTYYWLGTWR